MSAAKNWVTEAVHLYTFDIGDGEFQMEMCAAAPSEDEALVAIKNRLLRCGVERKIALQSVKMNVAKKTRTFAMCATEEVSK